VLVLRLTVSVVVVAEAEVELLAAAAGEEAEAEAVVGVGAEIGGSHSQSAVSGVVSSRYPGGLASFELGRSPVAASIVTGSMEVVPNVMQA